MWDAISINAVAGITDGTVYRITDITTKLLKSNTRGTRYATHITARRAATSSSYTAISVISPPNNNTSIQDNFDSYGNDNIAQPGSAGLFWLRLMSCDAGASGETLSAGASYNNTNHVEGTDCAQLPTGEYIQRTFTSVDFGQEGRFTDNDRLVIYYIATATEGTITVRFQGGGGALDVTRVLNAINGNQFFTFARTDFSGASNDWSAVDTLTIERTTGASDVFIDDVRISKSHVDDPLAPSDTGANWPFNFGNWFIYEDVAGVDYALGQGLPGPGNEETSIRSGDYSAIEHFACGILAREEIGSNYGLGLVAFAADADNCYRLILFTADDELRLYKVIAGTATEIASAAYPSSINTKYFLGLTRENGQLKAYISTSNTDIFTASNLLITLTSEDTYISGRIGIFCNGIMSRFFNVRAGLTTQPY